MRKRLTQLLMGALTLLSTCHPVPVMAQDSNRKTIPRLEVPDAFRPPVKTNCETLTNKKQGDFCWDSDNRILYIWDGTAFIAVGSTTGGIGGPVALTDLTDVTLSSAQVGQSLVKSNGDWINGAVNLANPVAVTGFLPDGNIPTTLTRDTEVASLDGVPLTGLVDFGDVCAGGEAVRRRADDQVNECFTPSSGGEANVTADVGGGSVSLRGSTPKSGVALNLRTLSSQFTETSNVINIGTLNQNTTGTAAALAVDPTTCGTNDFVKDISANGTLNCVQPTFASLPNSPQATDAQIPDNITISLAATATAFAGGNPANCPAGQAAGGVSSIGAAEDCFTPASEGASDLTGLSDVTISSAATGATLIKSAGDWVNGKLDLSDPDAVINTLPNANTTGVSTNSGNTLILRDSSGNFTANTITGAGGLVASTGQSFTVTAGCSIDTDVDCPASSTSGGSITLSEDTDLGGDTWSIALGSINLAAGGADTGGSFNTTTHVCTPHISGRLPDACIGDGSDTGGFTSFTAAGDGGSSQTISDTNTLTIAGGRSLTSTASATDTVTVAADVELYTQIKEIAIDSPVTGDSATVQLMFPTAVTITRIACSTNVATSTATIQFDERAAATPNTGGTDVMTSALACDTTEEATTSFTNASIAARVPMNLDIDATANTPTKLRIFVEYTIDD